MATDATLLDVEVGERTDAIRFDLIDLAGTVIGNPDIEYAKASIQLSGDQSIKRKLSGVTISPDAIDDVNPLTDRLRPMFVLENGSEFPLGVFLFADTSDRRLSYGLLRSGTLVDQGLITAQAQSYNVGVQSGTLVTDAIRTVAEAAGISTYSIDSSSAVVGSDLVLPAGSSQTWQKSLDYLASIAGFLPPYFDNFGLLRARALPDLSVATADLVYGDGGVNSGRVVAGSIVESNDQLKAPNRYVVIDTSATNGAVVATYDLPSTAPHSIAKRGFVIPKFISAPGVGSVDQALVLAQTAATTEPNAYETVVFAGSADPRHDTFNVIGYRGNLYIESGWTLPLAAGAEHQHTIRRVYL